MNYETALKLKEAGFQFTEIAGERNDPYDPAPDAEQMSKVGFVGGGVVPFVVFIGDTTFYKLPTLSELIEACMDFYYPSHFNMGGMETWWAIMRGEGNQKAIVPVQTGNTPEEAVANLWLALNSK